MEFNKKINMVLDVDEVLTCISPLWVNIMCKEHAYFSKYLNIPSKFNYKTDFYKVLLRAYFYLEISYGKKDVIDNLSEDEFNEFKDVYFSIIDNDDFYKMCRPTKFAKAIIALMNSNYINKLYIVSRCLKHNKTGKLNMLTDMFGKENISKIDIHLLDLHESKSDYINNLDNIDVIVDDELSNVKDIMTNCKVNPERGTDIYIPLYGYNVPDEEIFKLQDETDFRITYYEEIPGFNSSTYSRYFEAGLINQL